MAHLAILGYGVAPLVPVALVIVIVDPTNWVKILLQGECAGSCSDSCPSSDRSPPTLIVPTRSHSSTLTSTQLIPPPSRAAPSVTGVMWGGVAAHLSQRIVFLPPKTSSSSSSSLTTGVGMDTGTGTGGAAGVRDIHIRGRSTTSHLALLFFPTVLTLCYLSSFL
jgi:hypothetical protein